MDRKQKEYKTRARDFKVTRTRDDDGNPIIEGYFVVFDGIYEIGPGMTESVDRGAFDETLGDDIRVLVDHDTRLVLGRTAAGTADISVDDHGVFARVKINPNDSDAMNAHARVERGDVSQGSFGFEILSEDAEFKEDGSVHWTIMRVRLFELSVVTFPAYEDTDVSARAAQRDEIVQKRKKKKHEAWKETMLAKLNGGTADGTESTDAS